LIPTLKGGKGSRFRRWSVRDLIVTGQIALSVILVICSVLVVRSLQHALTLNLGFDPANAVSASFDLRLQGYDKTRSRSFDTALIAKISGLPEICGAGIISISRCGSEKTAPLSHAPTAPRPGLPKDTRQSRTGSLPGTYRPPGQSSSWWRDITSHDGVDGPSVAIVNRALTDLLFPGENPLGKRLRTSASAADSGLEIVGVVGTGKYESLGEDPKPVVFQPIEPVGTAETTAVVRTALPARQTAALLRKAILDLGPELTLYGVGGLKDQLALPLFPARAAAIVLGIFGFLAMVLAATGLFALMAYAVARRTREIGIRMALGARPRLVLSSLLRRTLVLCAAGVVTGALATLAAAPLLSSILYGISPRDPVTYATAILLMAIVALLACWNPAARAIHIDPARTLREE
jgi:predicted permease